MSKKIVIIGTGPAGLAAALKLSESGVSVCVIEAESEVGGLCASIRYDKYIFDYGGHRLYNDDKEIVDEIKRLSNDRLKVRKRRSCIFIKHKFIEYPLKLKNLLLNMKIAVIIGAILEYFVRFIRNIIFRKKENNLKDWIKNKFGKVLFSMYFKPYTEKFWGIPIEDLSVDWAAKRITLVGFWDVMSRLFSKRKSIPATYVLEFYYPEEGIGMIFKDISDEIKKNGGEIILNSKVVKFKLVNGNISSIVYVKNDKEFNIKPDYVISTMPITELVRDVLSETDQNIMNIVNKLEYRSMVFVFLMIDKERVSTNSWIYFPESQYIFSRITEPKNWSVSMGPQGKTSLCVEIVCGMGDDVWSLEKERLYQKVVEGLEEAELLKSKDVEGYFIAKWQYAYPIYTKNYSNNRDKLLKYLTRIKNLTTCGRQGAFNYGTTTEAMKMGFDEAEKILR